MKILITIVTFIAWSMGSSYWYVCNIKFLCKEKENITKVVESVPVAESIVTVDTVKVAPNIVEVKKVVFDKTFNIVFKYKSADYNTDPELEKSLKELAEYSKNNPTATVEIIGHTDNVGSETTNQELGLQRSESVMKTLYNYGATNGMLSPSSKGETDPIADNSTDSGRKSNRRVQIIVKN